MAYLEEVKEVRRWLVMIDYIIVGLVILAVIVVFVERIRSARKNKDCDGNCGSCGHKY